MSELTYQTATKSDLWKALQEMQQVSDDVCDGQCSQQAQRYIKHRPGWQPMFLLPGSGFGVGGVEIIYCPFCGKKAGNA